jgi:hypothetical protein
MSMSAHEKLRPGDLVELRPPHEILKTLSGDGALRHLPFMPEMLAFYGQRFHVGRRALMACYYGPQSYRTFPNDDVVTLAAVRCSGSAHDGCQKACTIFWREQWLQRADGRSGPPEAAPAGLDELRSRLKASSSAAHYYCQASEILRATKPLSRPERLARYVSGLRVGNIGLVEMIHGLGVFLILAARTKLFGAYPRGGSKPTRTEKLDLQPGEWVEVKPFDSILATLDERGRNRGLSFSPDMRRWCGRKLRVKGRLEKLIADGTGEMKIFRDTVALEGSTCGCAYVGLGMAGCARCELTYWREAWLRRCSEPDPGRKP